MTLNDWLIQAEKKTEDAAWLAAFGLGKDRTWLAINRRSKTLTLRERSKLDRLVARRMNDEPFAYITGTAPFYGRDFLVDKRVLIPRYETEDMIDSIKKTYTRKNGPNHFVDIGTGSGAIAITLALETDAKIFASDTNPRALALAKKNARRLAPGRIQFFEGNLLHAQLLKALQKIKGPITICANLPYLPESDKKVLPKSVIRYEPETALFALDAGMALNKKLLMQIAKSKIKANAIFEFDPPQSKKLLAFAKSLFPNASCSIVKDRCGRERFLKITSKLRQK